MNHNHKLREREDRKAATDDELRELYRSGWFINQIRAHYKVGAIRIRKLARECDAEMKA